MKVKNGTDKTIGIEADSSIDVRATVIRKNTAGKVVAVKIEEVIE